MTKQLDKNPVSKIEDLVADKFKSIKRRYSLNLDSVLSKSFNRAFDAGADMNPNSKAKKMITMSKLKALKKVMIGDIDKIEAETSQNTSRDIANAYATGMPHGKINKQLQDSIGGAQYKIDRSVRTTTAQLASLSKLIAWQAQGFTHYKWRLGKNDKVTREQHKKWHMKEFKIIDALEGRAPLPARVYLKNGKLDLGQSMNCRCGVVLSR
jgi:SPP1 gp7 family putative phage head morphogenesis protein